MYEKQNMNGGRVKERGSEGRGMAQSGRDEGKGLNRENGGGRVSERGHSQKRKIVFVINQNSKNNIKFKVGGRTARTVLVRGSKILIFLSLETAARRDPSGLQAMESTASEKKESLNFSEAGESERSQTRTVPSEPPVARMLRADGCQARVSTRLP